MYQQFYKESAKLTLDLLLEGGPSAFGYLDTVMEKGPLKGEKRDPKLLEALALLESAESREYTEQLKYRVKARKLLEDYLNV